MAQLKKIRIKRRQLYHAYRMAIAQLKGISYVQNSTSSVLPIVDKSNIETYGKC